MIPAARRVPCPPNADRRLLRPRPSEQGRHPGPCGARRSAPVEVRVGSLERRPGRSGLLEQVVGRATAGADDRTHRRTIAAPGAAALDGRRSPSTPWSGRPCRAPCRGHGGSDGCARRAIGGSRRARRCCRGTSTGTARRGRVGCAGATRTTRLDPRAQVEREYMTLVAPAAAARPTASSRWARVSVMNGRTGIRNTAQSRPASRTARTVANRAVVDGVPDSTCCCRSSSYTAIDIARSTGTERDASTRSGRSRRSSVPLVRTLNGVPDSASARMTPGIKRLATFGPLVGVGVRPRATGWRSQLGRPSSRRRTSATFVLTTICWSKSPHRRIRGTCASGGRSSTRTHGCTAVGVDRPPVGAGSVGRGHPVQGALRQDFVEGDAGELRRRHTADEPAVRLEPRERVAPLGAQCLSAPPHAAIRTHVRTARKRRALSGAVRGPVPCVRGSRRPAARPTRGPVRRSGP